MLRSLLLPLCLCTVSILAAEPPPIPQEPIAQKKELLFSDDFQGSTSSPLWHAVVPTFAVEAGVLKGTQTRDKEISSPDGKSVLKPHAAVHGLELPTTHSIVEVKVRFEGASMIDIEFDDRQFKGSHYGHLCRAQIRLNAVTLLDEKEGNMRLDIRAMNDDPSKKEERKKLLQGRSATFPVSLEKGTWYALTVETAGDKMRVSIDGKPVGFLQSPGIAHPTKSKIEFGVAGKDGLLDDLKVWNATPTP